MSDEYEIFAEYHINDNATEGNKEEEPSETEKAYEALKVKDSELLMPVRIITRIKII